MYTPIIMLALLSTSTLAAQVVTNANTFGAMLRRGDAIAKRQGYHPSTYDCGRGATCVEACGANHVECPSVSSKLYCHDSTDGSHCCPDGSGYACDAGDYCSHDGSGNTYCCLEGTNGVECAAAYSLTISLIRQTDIVAVPSATGFSSSLPAVAPIGSTSTPIRILSTVQSSAAAESSVLPSSTESSRISSALPLTSFISPTSKPSTTSTSSTVLVFTGGAGQVIGSRIAVLAVGLAVVLQTMS